MDNEKIIKILYLEDDEGLAYLLKERLEKNKQYSVETVNNGREGLERCLSGQFDILLVDLTMPEMNGLEVIQAIKTQKHSIPAIMISGSGNEASAVKALKAGAYDYLMKDIDGNYLELLPSVIERTFEQDRIINEKLETEIALKESEEKLRKITDSMLDAIITIDSSGLITFWNRAAEEMFGYAKEEVLGKNMHDLIAPKKFHDEIFKGMDGFKETGKGNIIGKTLTLPALKKDGTEFMADQSFSAEKIKGLWYATAIVRDITERLQMEEEIFKAQKLESVGVLAGGIAHDFNNILTAILGNTNLATILLTSGQTAKTFETLKNIEKATMRASDLTQQLLTFSKGGEPIKATMSIVDLIKNSSSFALRGSNVKSDIFVSDDLWLVEVDQGQINQVINNLVINAVHAMPDGGVVKITAENLDGVKDIDTTTLKNDKFVRVSIKDHGVGIEKDIVRKVFDPYFTTKETGSGLGLASSYSIIRKHNGTITVESEAGKGSVFHVYLPVSINDVAPPEMEVQDKICGSGRVLIMDDEEMIRDMAQLTLSHLGYEIECAEDGAKAIEMYEKAHDNGKSFDVVIMDLTVPGGMGGEETVKKLHETFPEAKAIVSSGYSNNPIMANFKDYGFCGVVCKPFDIKEINEILYKVIEG